MKRENMIHIFCKKKTFFISFFDYNYYNLFTRHVIFIKSYFTQKNFSSRQPATTKQKRRKKRNETYREQSNKVG